MRVDRGGTQGFQGRPPTKPLVITGGFPFLFEKIMIAIDFSRRFAIITFAITREREATADARGQGWNPWLSG